MKDKAENSQIKWNTPDKSYDDLADMTGVWNMSGKIAKKGALDRGETAYYHPTPGDDIEDGLWKNTADHGAALPESEPQPELAPVSPVGGGFKAEITDQRRLVSNDHIPTVMMTVAGTL